MESGTKAYLALVPFLFRFGQSAIVVAVPAQIRLRLPESE